MNHRSEYRNRTLVAQGQASEVLQPGVGALNDPAMLVAPQITPVLMCRFAIVFACRNDRLNTALDQQFTCRVAVVTFGRNLCRQSGVPVDLAVVPRQGF